MSTYNDSNSVKYVFIKRQFWHSGLQLAGQNLLPYQAGDDFRSLFVGEVTKPGQFLHPRFFEHGSNALGAERRNCPILASGEEKDGSLQRRQTAYEWLKTPPRHHPERRFNVARARHQTAVKA